MRSGLFISLLALMSLGCVENTQTANPPTDRPYYPTAMTLNGSSLALVSSNFSLRYQSGAILLLDVSRAAKAMADWDAQGTALENRIVAGKDVVTAYGMTPSFGDTPILRADGRVIFSSREQNKLMVLSGTGAQRNIEQELLLPERDPVRVLPLPDFDKSRRAVVAYLSSGKLDVVDLTSAKPVVAKSYDLNDLLKRKDENGFSLTLQVNDITLMGSGAAQKILVSGQFFQIADDTRVATVSAAVLIWFDVAILQSGLDLAIAQLKSFSVTDAARAKSVVMTQVIETPNQISVYAITQQPESLMQINLLGADGTSKGFESGRLVNRVASCEYPIDLVTAPALQRVYVVCFDGHAYGLVAAHDARTLMVKAINDSYGRGPFGLVLDDTNFGKTPVLLVSYFLDGSLGVLDAMSLKPRGRIFQQSPLNLPGGA